MPARQGARVEAGGAAGPSRWNCSRARSSASTSRRTAASSPWSATAWQGMPGVAAQFFDTLGNAGINVRAIAQGSSERNISAVIDRRDATRALRAAHSGFYLSAKTISLGLIGPGNVGATLLGPASTQADRLRAGVRTVDSARQGHSQHPVACTSPIARWTWRTGGTCCRRTARPSTGRRLPRHVKSDYLPHAAMLDCSASQDGGRSLPAGGLQAGIHVVTPNKKAASGPLGRLRRLLSECRRHHTHFLYETTVGAALPVIGTLRGTSTRPATRLSEHRGAFSRAPSRISSMCSMASSAFSGDRAGGPRERLHGAGSRATTCRGSTSPAS